MVGRNEEDEQGGRGDEWDPDDAELLDDSWDDAGWADGSGKDGRPAPRGGGGGGLRWLLLLLVIPVVALVVLQLQPDQSRSSAPVRTTSTTARSPSPTPSNQHLATVHVTGGPPRSRRPTVTRVGQHLLGITGDWDLFARGNNVVLRIQPARGRVTATPVPTLNSSGPVSFVVTTAGAIVRPLDSVAGYLVPDGKPARELAGALSAGGPVVPGPDPDHVWVESSGNGGSTSGVLHLVDGAGKQSGPDIPLPANALGQITPDGAGHPLVYTSGGVYDVTTDGLHRITTGTVEAVGPTGWLAIECDDRDRCSRVVVDRETGDRRTLPGTTDGAGDFFGDQGVIAPDGSAAVVFGPPQGPPQLQLVDLESGRSRVLSNDPAGQGPSTSVMAWSPDSRWLFTAGRDGSLLAVDPRTPGRAVSLGIRIPDVSQLVVRPAS